MTFDGALIKEQGVTFAIVVVKPRVLNSTDREKTRMQFTRVFGNVPIILMAQDSHGRPTYNGKRDIVNFLASIDARQIPWKTYTVNT